MKNPFLTLTVMAICALGAGSGAAWAGPGAPAGNPQIELMELPGGGTFSTGYNVDNVLTYNPRGRYGWSLEAKYTPLNSVGREGISVAPDGKTFALVGLRVLEVRDLASGGRRFTASLDRAESTQALLGNHAFSPDGTRVVISGVVKPGQPRLRVFDLRSGQMLQEIAPPHAADTLKWLSDAQVEIQWDAAAAEAKRGESFMPRLVGQTFQIAPAPEKFVPAQLMAAGAQADTPPKTTSKTGRARRKTTRRKSTRRAARTSGQPRRR